MVEKHPWDLVCIHRPFCQWVDGFIKRTLFNFFWKKIFVQANGEVSTFKRSMFMLRLFFLENIMVLSKFQNEWQGNLLNSSVTEKWSINSIKRPLCLFSVCKTLMHSKSNTRWLTIHVLEIRASKLRSINVNISQLLQAQFISLRHSVKKCCESKWMLMEKSSTSCEALVPC